MIKGNELKIDVTEVYLFYLPYSNPSDNDSLVPLSRQAKNTIARTT